MNAAIPEHMKHLVGEISEKDLLRLIEMEQKEAPLDWSAITQLQKGQAQPNSRPATGSVLRKPADRSASDTENEQGFAVDYIPRVEDIELKNLRALEETKKEEEADDNFRLPTPEDLVVASEVGVLSVGMVFENSFFQLRGMKRAFTRQPAIVRGLELIAVAAAILVLIGFVVLREVKAYVRSQSGPFLAEALVAPYDLEKREVPAQDVDASLLIPATIGKYQRNSQPITRGYPSSPTNQCLLGLGYEANTIDAPNCNRSYGSTGVAYGRYVTGDWKNADLVIARFSNTTQAEGTMFDLLHHARKFGQVGNFSIGVGGEVSYFYSAVQLWYSFTWSHGPWIFSVSGPSLKYVEEIIEKYNIPQTDPLRPSVGA